jgi:hypothetical protein
MGVKDSNLMDQLEARRELQLALAFVFVLPW